jgi:hypothetical protein
MKLSQLGLVQRVVLSAAVPTVALLLLLQVHWFGRMEIVMGGKREEITFTIFLSEQSWFWATTVAAVAAWLCVLWAPRRDPVSPGESVPNSQPQAMIATSGTRGSP